MAELRAHEIVERSAVPAFLHQKIVRARQRLQPLAEPLQEALDVAGMLGGLARHRLDHGQKVFRAMRQFAHQEAQMRLALFSLGDIDGRAGQPDDGPLGIAQGLDVEVVPPHVPGYFDPVFGIARLAACKHIALGGDDGRPIERGDDVVVGMAEHIFGRQAEERLRHEGVAELAILRKHVDFRAMQSGFEPGLGGIALARAFEDPHLRFAPDRIELPARGRHARRSPRAIARKVVWDAPPPRREAGLCPIRAGGCWVLTLLI